MPTCLSSEFTLERREEKLRQDQIKECESQVQVMWREVERDKRKTSQTLGCRPIDLNKPVPVSFYRSLFSFVLNT